MDRLKLDAGAGRALYDELASSIARFDPTKLSEALQGLLETGTGAASLDPKKINIIGRGEAGNQAPKDFMEALKLGTRLMDALVYFSLPEKSRPPPKVSSDAIVAPKSVYDGTNPILGQIAKHIAYIFMFVLIRARYPEGNGSEIGRDVPAFLRQIVPESFTNDEIVSSIATFKLDDLGFTWLKGVNFINLGDKTRNRLALGIAGRRLPSLFKYLEKPKDLPADAEQAYATALAIANLPISWDWHPATRKVDLITIFGSVNKNLADLAAYIFPAEDLQRARDLKYIFQIPTRDGANSSWKTWKPAMIPDIEEPIKLQAK